MDEKIEEGRGPLPGKENCGKNNKRHGQNSSILCTEHHKKNNPKNGSNGNSKSALV